MKFLIVGFIIFAFSTESGAFQYKNRARSKNVVDRTVEGVPCGMRTAEVKLKANLLQDHLSKLVNKPMIGEFTKCYGQSQTFTKTKELSSSKLATRITTTVWNLESPIESPDTFRNKSCPEFKKSLGYVREDVDRAQAMIDYLNDLESNSTLVREGKTCGSFVGPNVDRELDGMKRNSREIRSCFEIYIEPWQARLQKLEKMYKDRLCDQPEHANDPAPPIEEATPLQ
jgi:hypothetical protein